MKHITVMGLALLGRLSWGLARALEGPWDLELWEEWDNRGLYRWGRVVYIGVLGWRMISLEGGSWNLMFSTALPKLSDSRWNTAGRPCCQKLAA